MNGKAIERPECPNNRTQQKGKLMSGLLERMAAMKATERKAEAIAAYDSACEAPGGADWQTIAHALRRVLPNARKLSVPGDADGESGAFATWFELKRRPSNGSGKDFGSTHAEITFADGRTIRAYAITHKGSAPNIAGACRAACDLWRYKTQPAGYEWRATVPEIVRAYIPETGAEYDPAHASAYTVEMREPEPERTPSLYDIREAMQRRLDWFDCAPLWLNIHREANQERLEHVWPPVSDECEPEAVPMVEAMPEPEAPPVRAVSPLARKLLSSAMSGPMPEHVKAPCIMIARRPAFSIAA